MDASHMIQLYGSLERAFKIFKIFLILLLFILMIAVNLGGKSITNAPYQALKEFLTVVLAGGPRTGPTSGSMLLNVSI
jgi:hypothetical protein